MKILKTDPWKTSDLLHLRVNAEQSVEEQNITVCKSQEKVRRRKYSIQVSRFRYRVQSIANSYSFFKHFLQIGGGRTRTIFPFLIPSLILFSRYSLAEFSSSSSLGLLSNLLYLFLLFSLFLMEDSVGKRTAMFIV